MNYVVRRGNGCEEYSSIAGFGPSTRMLFVDALLQSIQILSQVKFIELTKIQMTCLDFALGLSK